MRFCHLSVACLAILCVILSACAPRGPRPEIAHPAIPADLVLVRSINAQTAESAHMESASLNISDPKNLAGQFEERLERMLWLSGSSRLRISQALPSALSLSRSSTRAKQAVRTWSAW